jgi:Short C-terminal domain
MEKNMIFIALLKVTAGGAKAGRAMLHGVADVLTLGLWEVIGTPVESANDGDLTAYEVSYGKDDRVDQVITLIQPANTASQPNQSNVPPAFREQQSSVDTPASQQAISNPLPNPADKLEQLDQMRKKGLITQKDYDAKKAEILKTL